MVVMMRISMIGWQRMVIVGDLCGLLSFLLLHGSTVACEYVSAYSLFLCLQNLGFAE